MINFLQSDIKTAVKSAFGILDGPLSVNDRCKGHNHSFDAGIAGEEISPESSINECTYLSSTVMLSVAEPMSPSQYSAGGSSCLIGKLSFCRHDGMIDFSAINILIVHAVSSATGAAKVDGTCQRRSYQEICTSEPCTCLRPRLFALPLPAILVGYDMLKKI